MVYQQLKRYNVPWNIYGKLVLIIGMLYIMNIHWLVNVVGLVPLKFGTFFYYEYLFIYIVLVVFVWVVFLERVGFCI